MGKKHISPQQDAGWGLIYRLNDLWRKVERVAPDGKYTDWDFTLDRIWCNLLYREEIIIIRDENTKKIKLIGLSKGDKEEKDFLDGQINIARNNIKPKKSMEVSEKKEILIARRKYYNLLMLKDIWLRKMMNQLGLYLKEIEYDPSKAIYGGH